MQFSLVAIFATLTGIALASPMPLHQIRACDIGKCSAALGPTAIGCGAAGVEAGANPVADAACLAGVLNSVANVPAACSGCV